MSATLTSQELIVMELLTDFGIKCSSNNPSLNMGEEMKRLVKQIDTLYKPEYER